jgi:hypothetical protein
VSGRSRYINRRRKVVTLVAVEFGAIAVKAKAKVEAAFAYCLVHRKQLVSAVMLGAGLLETIQKAH